jgi:two-component system chemotaxis response regulator CheV
VFQLREQVVPCVSLIDHLGTKPREGIESESTLILTDFNQQQTAFLVDEVERIHRISWENILAVPNLPALRKTPVTAVARVDDQLVITLDFEMIIDEVTDQMFRAQSFDNPLGLPREDLKILLADDSPSVREAVSTTLDESGYKQLTVFQNGAEAWDWITRTLAETGSVQGVGDLLICDIEMPQIDGFHLTKRIKEHPQLKSLPVLLYSSIATTDNHKKGEAVGADDQITKPELHRVVEIADRLISEARDRDGDGESPAAAMEKAPPIESPAAKAPASSPQTSAIAPTKPTAAEPATSQTASAEMPEPSDENWTPSGVNPHLWVTFRRELSERAAHLSGQIPQVNANEQSEAVRTEICRTLHTIKSAAMVVPVAEVTDTTHAMESALQVAREENRPWPQATLTRYAEWLAEIANPFVDARQSLANVSELQATITGDLATSDVAQMSP